MTASNTFIRLSIGIRAAVDSKLRVAVANLLTSIPLRTFSSLCEALAMPASAANSFLVFSASISESGLTLFSCLAICKTVPASEKEPTLLRIISSKDKSYLFKISINSDVASKSFIIVMSNKVFIGPLLFLFNAFNSSVSA